MRKSENEERRRGGESETQNEKEFGKLSLTSKPFLFLECRYYSWNWGWRLSGK